MNFEWDEEKNASNKVKHAIDFRDAVKVFDDHDCITREDDRESYGEARYQAIGTTAQGVLVVVFTERHEDVIRIISARRADKAEKRLYANGTFY